MKVKVQLNTVAKPHHLRKIEIKKFVKQLKERGIDTEYISTHISYDKNDYSYIYDVSEDDARRILEEIWNGDKLKKTFYIGFQWNFDASEIAAHSLTNEWGISIRLENQDWLWYNFSDENGFWYLSKLDYTDFRTNNGMRLDINEFSKLKF